MLSGLDLERILFLGGVFLVTISVSREMFAMLEEPERQVSSPGISVLQEMDAERNEAIHLSLGH